MQLTSGKTVTVADAYEYWLDDRKQNVRGITVSGYKAYRHYIVGPLLSGTPKQRMLFGQSGTIPDDCFLEPMLGDMSINALTTAEIRRWNKKLEDMVGTYSANRAKKNLKAILALAKEDLGVLPPEMPIRLGRNKAKFKKAILSLEHVSELIQFSKKDKSWGIYYAFPFLAGTRPSEQLGLLWSEVDLEQKIIRIRRILDRIDGLIEVTKTDAGNRDIPISPMLHEMLSEWRMNCPRKNGVLHLVFPSPGRMRSDGTIRGGGGPLSYTNYRNRIWVKGFARMGLPYVTPHSARHTFISTLQVQGTEVGLVAKLAGHTNPAVTLSHYTQAMRGGVLALEGLDAAYRATS